MCRVREWPQTLTLENATRVLKALPILQHAGTRFRDLPDGGQGRLAKQAGVRTSDTAHNVHTNDPRRKTTRAGDLLNQFLFSGVKNAPLRLIITGRICQMKEGR